MEILNTDSVLIQQAIRRVPSRHETRKHDRSPYEYESVNISYDVNDALTVAVGDWVLSEYQEVTEHNQVCSG